MDEDTGEDDGGVFGDADAMRAYRHTAERQQDAQHQRARTLDLKLIATFPLNAALLALMSTSLPAALAPSWHLWFLVSGGAACFAVYLWYASRAYRSREWSARPDLSRLLDVAQEFPAAVVDEWIGLEIAKSIEQNEEVLSRKSTFAWRAFQCTLGVAVFGVATAIVARVA